MSLSSFFGTVAETKELHSVIALRSRYYKTNYNKAKAAVLEYTKQSNLNIGNIDDSHKEILLQSNKYHIIVSFIQVTPIETAIDIKVEVYGLFGLNRPQKMIVNYYKYLDENLSFKGVGLHP